MTCVDASGRLVHSPPAPRSCGAHSKGERAMLEGLKSDASYTVAVKLVTTVEIRASR